MMENKARIELLDEINKILVEEDAKPIKEDDLLTYSELDSFGYTMLFFQIDEQYNCFNSSYVNSIDFNKYTGKDLIDKIEVDGKL